MIAIVEYGMGNVGSIRNMLLRLGANPVITSDPGCLKEADRLILPGVGSFDLAMQNLKAKNLIDVLNRLVIEQKKPILGICLGMQLFSRSSDEGSLPGLGWIEATTRRFTFPESHPGLRLPHMGWNEVRVHQPRAIFSHSDPHPRFYFVHTYHMECDNSDFVLAEATYGIPFTAAVIRENVMGTQFHPEKSHKYGVTLFRNFLEIPGG